jgi:hypothetical protein
MGAFLSGLAAYVWAIPTAVREAGHLTAIVGSTVQVRETRRLRIRLFSVKGHVVAMPRPKRVPVGQPGRREYVYDVALEGVQFAAAGKRERDIPRTDEGEIAFEKQPRKVKLKDLQACDPAERAFSGCGVQCSGINWYCIENPRCFAPK